MNNTHVKVRKVKNNDLPYIKAMFAEDTMAEPGRAACLQGFVAANAEDKPVGFIRVLKVIDKANPRSGGNYVYPVIVFKYWQGHGVGRVLIKYAHKKFGELKLVACATSREFYPKCGFEPLEWGEVAPRIANDCTHCTDLKTCKPQAFILR